MNHVFIVNPKAGKKDITNELISQLQNLDFTINYQVYVTSKPQDAYEFTKDYCKNHSEVTRFYACGGDGTLNEVVNGIMNFPNKSVACYPSGSGNDFIKNFGEKKDFLDLKSLIQGQEKDVDVLSVNGRSTINICNLGFDAFVADNMIKFKNKPFMNGHTAYQMAVLYSLLFKMKHRCQVSVDGENIFDSEMLLCAIANGKCYGGGYYCAPEASIDDGLFDVLLVKKITRFQLLKFIKKYKLGIHLNDSKLRKLLIYKKAKEVVIKAVNDLIYCMDGEIARAKEVVIKILPKAIKFVIPKNILDN